MDFNRDAELDTSNITDERFGGGDGGGLGGRVAIGGGGVSILGVIIYLVLSQLGGGIALPDAGAAGPAPATGSSDDPRSITNACRTGGDADDKADCEIAGLSNSIDRFWADTFARSGQRYRPPGLHVFTGATSTGCGSATADVGPFYCPADRRVYIDLSFYQELQTRFGARGGTFAHAYVIAHEYGHHIQNLLGRSTGGSAQGATSGSVRLELQADCYAGVWANHAQQTRTASGKPLVQNITRDDVDAALDTASRIGDDYIQSQIAGRDVDRSQFTHGSSAQREKWLTTGLNTGDPARCNTFARGADLG